MPLEATSECRYTVRGMAAGMPAAASQVQTVAQSAIIHSTETFCSIAPEGVVSRRGLPSQVRSSASCKFAVSLSLELLEAGLSRKLGIALHVVSGYFSA